MSSAPGSVITGLNPTDVNPSDPFPLFVIQAVIIIGLCYILHFGLRKLKQPRVISEVIAGIILGPSVMGRIPGFATTIFNPAGLPYLNLVSNIGLVFFLFLVGLELDPALVVKRARFALGISFAGMALPFGVGAAVSYILYEELGPNSTVSFGQFLLFCGVAMSITAFPVLARILAEQKLLTTKVGFLTVCAGAVGDIVAWILLALVVSIINSASRITPLYVVLLSIAWVLVLVFIFRPVFTFMIRITKSEDEPSQTMMAFTMAMVLISGFVTDIIGVHEIFGAFLVGLIIPNDTGFADGVTKRIEDLVSVIFLPIYFALSGLKTQVGLLDNGRIWGLVILTTFVACFGKITGCSLAARAQGMEWRESFAIGVLMNCKGLIELIVLNIGYDAGVINDKVFVIMIAMCLITTCMTSPGISWVYPAHYQRAVALRTLEKERKKKGDVERADPLGDLENNSKGKGYMLCLEKIHHLPALMTFLEMLHHTTPQADNVGAHGGNHASLAVPGSQAPFVRSGTSDSLSVPKILALRLLHLTERSSSVLLAATERAEVLRRDTLMTVFQAFAKLNNIPVRPLMTLSTDPDDFAQSIYEEAIDAGAGTIIVPWNSSTLPDPPMISAEDEAPVLSRPLVTSNTQMVSRILSTTINTGLVTAIFVDREFGGSGHFSNIMVPLYGSRDDEEALKLASAMSHNRICNILIVRIEASRRSLDEKNAEEDSLDIDCQSIDSDDEAPALPDDNQVLTQTYFPHRAFPLGDRRLNHKKVSANNTVEAGLGLFVHAVPTLQDAIGLAKAVLGSRDLLVMGRGYASKSKRHHAVLDPVPQQPLATYTATGIQPGAHSSKSPGLHLQQLPTGFSFSLSATNTPTNPIDNPLGDGTSATTAAAVAGSSGLRHRQTLKSQPSSRDLSNSFMTVCAILGVAAQKFLASEVASCFLVVQSGARHASSTASQPLTPGIEFSREPSAVTAATAQAPLPQQVPLSGQQQLHRGVDSHERPLGFEREHAPDGEYADQQL